ncbi:hypothetical protein N2W54_002344 [Lotmaria passim]
MSFQTKFAMWWGSVTTKTEKMFNKEKKRMVTHEYYDNPNAKTARPKSMHSIRGSMRLQNSARGSQGFDDDSEPQHRSSSKHSFRNKEEEENYSDDDVKEIPKNDYQGGTQNPYVQKAGGGMPQHELYMNQQQQQQMLMMPDQQQQMMMMPNQQQQMMMMPDQQQQMMMMPDQQYAQQQFMDQQQMQGGFPSQGFPQQGFSQGY